MDHKCGNSKICANIEIIKTRYLSGESTPQIAKDFNVTYSHISRTLRLHGIQIRKTGSKKYQESFNKWNINTEEGAYWLGFLLADGYLVDGKMPKLSVNLSRKDIDHLIKFRDWISPQRPIKEFNNGKTDMCNITIGNKYIVRHLKSIGFLDFKSGNPTICNLINDRNMHHFIRGFFDGDGCISLTWTLGHHSPTMRYPRATFVIVSPHKTIIQIINAKLPISTQITCDRRSTRTNYIDVWRLSTASFDKIVSLSDWLYKGAVVYLNRKYQKFMESHDVIVKHLSNPTGYRGKQL